MRIAGQMTRTTMARFIGSLVSGGIVFLLLTHGARSGGSAASNLALATGAAVAIFAGYTAASRLSSPRSPVAPPGAVAVTIRQPSTLRLECTVGATIGLCVLLGGLYGEGWLRLLLLVGVAWIATAIGVGVRSWSWAELSSERRARLVAAAHVCSVAGLLMFWRVGLGTKERQ